MSVAPDLLRAYFQWEVRSWSRALPLWTDALAQLPAGPRTALALGERDGGLSLYLAQQSIRTVCSDLRGPTDEAHQQHRSHGVQALIAYETIDTLAIPKPDASFDVVIFKSMIGALGSRERQQQAIREMHRVLKPGGVLLFAENLSGTAVHRWLRKRFVAWDAYWRYLDVRRDRDLFAPFVRMDDRTTGLLANLGRTEIQRDLLARIDALVAPFVPSNWRTIWYGAAFKDRS
ncbi:MAG: class I SAM-dependent methyltransferase [Flavobacteriales bacterium]